VIDSADVAVSLTAAPQPVFVGSNLTYNVVITNNGPFAAPGVKITNTLPASVSLKSGSASQGTLTTNGNQVLGNFGTIAVGSLVTVTLVAIPHSTGNITNVASVISGYPDPAVGNNLASIVTTVLPLPVLSVGLISGNHVRLSWPVTLTGYVLEYKGNLAASTPWSIVATTPTISGNEKVVIENNTAAASFYRLRK
jgi:uncharacterized repeat protein (TIGR01451 family)